MQTNLFTAETMPPRQYRIQKYKISYVKEPMESVTVTSKKDVSEFCLKKLSDNPYESVLIIALDNSNKITGFISSEGTTNQCACYPKNIFAFLFSCAASAFILAHNHPGGAKRASEADWQLTEQLQKIGKLLELPLFDHLIVAENETISLRENSRWKN